MRRGNTLGIILILMGIAWIIHQSGIVTINWIEAIRVLWPIFLITIGASFLLGHRKRLVLGIWIVTFVVFIGFGIYKRDESNMIYDIKNNFQVDLGPLSKADKQPIAKEILLSRGTEEGRLLLQLGAVDLKLSAGSNEMLVQTETDIPNLKQRLVEGKQTIVEYSHDQLNQRSSIRNFDIQMNPTLLWEVDSSLGAVDGVLDFTEVPVKQIDLKLGAGSLDVIIGTQQVDTKVILRAGAAGLNIYIPEGVGLRVKSGKLLTDLNFHNIQMTKEDDYFTSEHYNTANQKIEMDIQTAVSAIHILPR